MRAREPACTIQRDIQYYRNLVAGELVSGRCKFGSQILDTTGAYGWMRSAKGVLNRAGFGFIVAFRDSRLREMP